MLSYFGIRKYCTLVRKFHIVSMDVGNNCYNYKTQMTQAVEMLRLFETSIQATEVPEFQLKLGPNIGFPWPPNSMKSGCLKNQK